MDLFDIVWLVICIGLPIVSVIASAGKKRKAGPVPPGGERDVAADLRELFEGIGGELEDTDTESDHDEDDEDVTVSPAPVGTAAPRPVDSSLNMMTVSAQRAETCVKDRAADVAQTASVKTEDKGKQSVRERIDPKKLIEYNAIMNPVSKDC